MQTIPVIFTKCFYKENIVDDLRKNSDFTEITSNYENFQIFTFPLENSEQYNLSEKSTVYSVFKAARIYVYEKSYIFISTEYETELLEDNNIYLGKTTYRICHNTDSVYFPENEIIRKLFSFANPNSTISFLQPDGYTIKRYDYNKDDFDKYISCDTEDFSRTFSFIFYNYQLSESFHDLTAQFQQGLKNAVYGNSSAYSNYSDIPLIYVNNNYSILPSRIGVGLLSSPKSRQETIESFYYKYLEALKSLIHFEIKSKEFNKAIDENNYANLDELNKSVRKEMRNAVHLRYDIKNSLSLNNQASLFWGKLLSSINFDETLTEFIEICHSIEKEIRAEIDKREEEHDKRFDKILSLVAVFAIVSVFKDGSDLIISFIDAIKNTASTRSFDFSNLISFVSPVFSIIVIYILIKIFNKKK